MIQRSEKFKEIVSSAKKEITEITIAEVKQKIANNETFHFVDVREESEYAKGSLPNAIHIGKGVIERDIQRLIPESTNEVILFCGGGSRSALAALNVKKMGYINVKSMIGGFRGWNEDS